MRIPRRISCKLCDKKFANQVRKSGICVVTCPDCRQAIIDEGRAKKKRRRKK
jgi:Zn-finger nucleic acid-binding protein